MLQQVVSSLLLLAAVSLTSARIFSSKFSTPDFCDKYDCPPYTLLSRGTNYEERSYARSNWVSTSLQGRSRMVFWNLLRYIKGANERNESMEMTVPVLKKLVPGSQSYTEMSFYISNSVVDPPAPTEGVTYLQTFQNGFTVYVKSFRTNRWATSRQYEEKYNELASDLREAGKTFQDDYYYTAGYSGPRVLQKYNEVWIRK